MSSRGVDFPLESNMLALDQNSLKYMTILNGGNQKLRPLNAQPKKLPRISQFI